MAKQVGKIQGWRALDGRGYGNWDLCFDVEMRISCGGKTSQFWTAIGANDYIRRGSLSAPLL